MNRHIVVAMGLACALALSACGKKEEAVPVETAPVEAAAPAAESAPAAVEQEADASAAVQSCTQDCGDGVVATIQCAAGETAVCDCAVEPKAKCEPVAAEAQPEAAAEPSAPTQQ